MTTQEEELIKGAIQIYHGLKKNFDSLYLGRELGNLLVNFKNSSLSEMLTDFDFESSFISLTLQTNRTSLRYEVRNLTDQEISRELRSRIFTKKKYEYYAPINRLHGFPTNMTLGFVNVLNFQDLPQKVRNPFLGWWKNKFSLNKEWFVTEEQCIKVKERLTFIHFSVEAMGNQKANEKAKIIAEDALNIVRFLYEDNFQLMDMLYTTTQNKEIVFVLDGFGHIKIGETVYSNEDTEKALRLNNILTKDKPNEIENKLRNSLRLYGIQTELSNLQVRFVTLVTCLECLLMTNGDKDYLAWKLAEKPH